MSGVGSGVGSGVADGRATQPRLLVVKLGAIGDVVMAIPAAFEMHRKGYQVDWLCGEPVAPMLRLYPWIRVFVVDEHKLLRGSVAERVRALSTLWYRLAGRRYDVCATLYYDARYRVLTLPVRVKRRIALSRENRATMLLPGRHHTDEYARILLGRPDGETPLQLAPVPMPGLPENPLPCTFAKTRIVLVPGGAKNGMRDDALRRWPVENYVAVAEALLAMGHEVVLLGGPDDAWVKPLFAHLEVADEIGRWSLLESLALLDSADVTVTHDTGPLHLAGIVSTAIVTLFGPTDPHGRLPQRVNCVALWGGEHFACRPCYDGRDYAPCAHNGCIREITPAMVVRVVERLLEAVRLGRAIAPQVLTPGQTAAWGVA